MPIMVAIDGVDAAGKATQSQLLAKYFDCDVVSFPDYSTPTGGLIKEHLNGEWSCSNVLTDAMVFQCLMAVNRLEVLPTVNLKKSVVFDRYWASGVVYGKMDCLDTRWLELIQSSFPQPDVYILLDIPADESFKRRPDRRDRYEKKGVGWFVRVREEYVNLFESKRKAGNPWYIVDGIGNQDEVHRRIIQTILSA